MAQPLSRTDVIKPTLQQKDPDINGYSLAWQLRFEAVRRAGGEGVRWLRYPSKNLTLTDRRTILINIPAFIFGPFYYIYLGMWKKAITLTILCLIFGAVLSSIFLAENIQSAYLVTGVLNGLIFSSKVNIDYYRKIYFKEKSWW